jgi:heme exporter protein A
MTLNVENLTVARGGRTVLERVSFRVNPGQALVVTGPNGIGKTTLLRTLAGLQPPAYGQITAPTDGIVYAAHADAVKPTLTVQETLAFWAAVFGGGPVGPALAAMNLHALSHRPAGSLSAGQKRRLGLARLLVTARPIWLLDEPTVSLDDASVALFGAMIAAHRARGGLAVIASHQDLGLTQATNLDLTPFAGKDPWQASPFDGVTA